MTVGQEFPEGSGCEPDLEGQKFSRQNRSGSGKGAEEREKETSRHKEKLWQPEEEMAIRK